ncbi:MAG: carboxypeptidase regulatory-like domain-containing protein [Chloroflexi bacterium]|nr:carboxypeptidase regulatory-like domain-containing protein [Chloroflexota bacterium]
MKNSASRQRKGGRALPGTAWWATQALWPLLTLAAALACGPAPSLASDIPGPGGAISGRVYQADGVTPIPNAEVWAESYDGAGGNGYARTAADGSYTIRSLPAGEYRVEALAQGLPREYYFNTPDYASATRVAVASGLTTTGINFTLAPTQPAASPTATSTPTPSPTPSPTVAVASGGQPLPTPTPAATPTPNPTPTLAPAPTPVPTPTSAINAGPTPGRETSLPYQWQWFRRWLRCGAAPEGGILGACKPRAGTPYPTTTPSPAAEPATTQTDDPLRTTGGLNVLVLAALLAGGITAWKRAYRRWR